MTNQTKKDLMYGIGSLLIGYAAKAALREVWKRTKGSAPPENPSKPEVETQDAIIWSLALAGVSALVKVWYKKNLGEHIFDEDSVSSTENIIEI